jgi:hypothetical protein
MEESNDIYSNDRPSASDPLDQQPFEVAHCADISARDEAMPLRDTREILTDEMLNVPDKGIVAPIVDWQSRMITLLVQEVSVLHEKLKLADERRMGTWFHIEQGIEGTIEAVVDEKLQDFKDRVLDDYVGEKILDSLSNIEAVVDEKLQDFKDHVFDNFDIDDYFDLSDYGYHIEDLIDERMRNNLTDEIKEILRDSTLEINGRIIV